MDKTKGWPKLLEACKILKQRGGEVKFKCNFVGSFQNEQDKKKFYNFIDKNNLKKEMNYLGRKTGKEKNKILENSDVLVFPTEYPLETFGRVIVEAMMFSLPVIANGIATIPNIINNNKTGFILKENTGKEIANYLEKLYKNKKLRIKMEKEGRKRFLKDFELNKYRNKFKKILKRVLRRI